MELQAGTLLGGRYEIAAPLGAGGMGEVYRAHDLRLGRDVAVKVLPERFTKDDQASARFEREARTLATLSHPNVLTLHDSGTDQGVSFVVTELLAGATLREVVGRSAVPWPRTVEIGVAVAGGLAAAHSRGVIHRDVKPENVFLTEDGSVKILDFGLAHWEDEVTPGDQDTSPTLPLDTRPGTLLGTVPYMSPEQLRGLPLDARTDIFSLGCVLYEMLAGRAAFRRATAPDTMAAILLEAPLPLAGSDWPQELEDIVRSCLEKSPDDRFQSAQDLGLALKTIASGARLEMPTPLPVARGKPTRRRRSRAIRSIAVLPIAHDAADPDVEYLADGITESIIHSLSQIPRLRVMARSTVFRYKGGHADPREVGSRLDVQSVLTGHILRRGDALAITTELVDGADGSRLWGERYDSRVADLLSVQEDIASRITEKLRGTLTGDDRARLRKRHTESPEAYQLYLKGRYHWAKRTEDAFGKAIAFFEEAVAEDAGYALAYAGLADCYSMMQYYGTMPPKDAMAKTRAMALRALELDDRLAEAHTSLGGIKLYHDWDWKGAEEEFRRALDFDPSHVPARHWYGEMLNITGRHDEALRELQRGLELDPLSILINGSIADVFLARRRADEAIEKYRKSLELDPDSASERFWLGLATELKGSLPDAIAQFQRAVELSEGHAEYMAALGHALALAGQTKKARGILRELEGRSAREYVSAYHLAVLHAGLGEPEAALAQLDRAYQERAGRLIYLRVDPRFDGFRPDPRFVDLMGRVGLAP